MKNAHKRARSKPAPTRPPKTAPGWKWSARVQKRNVHKQNVPALKRISKKPRRSCPQSNAPDARRKKKRRRSSHRRLDQVQPRDPAQPRVPARPPHLLPVRRPPPPLRRAAPSAPISSPTPQGGERAQSCALSKHGTPCRRVWPPRSWRRSKKFVGVRRKLLAAS